MLNYGTRPNADEIEVIVFGPGYGEAIAIHLGDDSWILVDSCIDPETKLPASLQYLNQIGVTTDRVRAIIASHWHDDHVKGISTLVTVCPNAELIISGIFNDQDTFSFLCAYGGASGTALTGGARELYQSVLTKRLQNNGQLFFAYHRSMLYTQKMHGHDVVISAFTPTSQAQAQSKAHIGQYLPATVADPINYAPDFKPNITSVVIHIKIGDDAVLLGSDLENYKDCGWQSVVSNSFCKQSQLASLYKVAHHGSANGDHPHIWTTLLSADPVAVLTPFINGSVNLPTPMDKTRIQSSAGEAYISSRASKKPKMENELLKRLSDICTDLSPVNTGFGSVRFRKKFGDLKWKVDLFGLAEPL